MSHVLGIDVSTTAAKAVLMDRAGAVTGVGNSSYETQAPRPLWSEQDPRSWWTAACEAIGAALAAGGIDGRDVEGVGLTGQMHGLVLLDAAGSVLRPAILWNDQRTSDECDLIRARVGRERLIAVTGNDALPGFTAPKLLWVRTNEPDVWARAAHVLLPKDYVRYCMSGDLAVDRADGAGTLLFDLEAREWSPEITELLEVPHEWLPQTYEGPEVTGTVSPEAADATGLRAGTPIVAGGGDQAAAAVGVGAVEPGIVSVSLGTSGVVFATTDKPVIEPDGRLHSFCHSVPGKWHVMGVMLSAAGSLRWLRDALAADRSYDELLSEAEAASAGSSGLLFLPYLTGERTPHPDPLARGAFVGLTAAHERGHLVRSVLEGVAFGLRDCFELMRNVGLGDSGEVRATGGGSESGLWRQILADVLSTRVVTTSTPEGAAQGAAILGAVGTGRYPSVEAACRAVVETRDQVDPSPAADVYDDLYGTYRSLYPALSPAFRRLSGED